MLSKFNNELYRLYRVCVRTIIRFSPDPRPASYPYISGDGFRKIAQHIYDGSSQSIDPINIKSGDIVFIGDSHIKKFLKKISPSIQNPYIIISHNGDESIDEEVINNMGGKIIKWYGINIIVNHPDIVPIPLGLGNKHYYVTGIPSIFRNIAKKNYHKVNRIFYGFTSSTNPTERGPALDVMKRNKFADTIVKWMNFPNYMRLLATYKFVASPPGSSVEGHRTWEALYVGVIPIVKSSVTMDYFKKLKIPLWVVDEWSELDSVSEKILEEKYKVIQENSSMDAMYMDYWIDKIKNVKD